MLCAGTDQFPCEETGDTGREVYCALGYTGLEGNEDSAFSGLKKKYNHHFQMFKILQSAMSL